MQRVHVGVEDLEALRAPLTAYCYRLLGAAAEAEDAVQETLLRASSRLDRYDSSRAGLSTWVHRIATNICLDMLRAAKRRALVLDLTSPAGTGGDLGAPLSPDQWVEPMPDARLLGTASPEEVWVARETVRLAFIAALQRLPPRQRAVLVLRDVLMFTAREAADILESTVPAVNSALQRARAEMASDRPDPGSLSEPDDPDHRDLLRRYVAAFEAHDVAGLTALLREDAVASMPPFQWQLVGAERIAQVMGSSAACAGARLVACGLNGSVGFGQYRPGQDGLLHPFALVALDVREGKVAGIVTFLGTQDRFAEFGLPQVLAPPRSD